MASSYELRNLQQRYINNTEMRSSNPETKPRHFVGIPQNAKFLPKRSPSYSPKSDYENIQTAIESPQTIMQRPQYVNFKMSNPEQTLVSNKQKAYTPPEQSNSYPFENRRPNTPDGRYRDIPNPYETHPTRIKEYCHYISPLASKNSQEMFQTEMYTRDDTKDRLIELLETRHNRDQEEIRNLRQLNDELRARNEVVSVESIQAKNLLSHETQENMHLTNQLYMLKREIEELREKHLMVSRRAGCGIPYGHVRNHDHQYYPTANREQLDEQSHYHIAPQHIPATRAYSYEIEEMKQKLIKKDNELEQMRVTCANERKEKQNYYQSYEEALQLLEKEISGR